MPTLLTAPPLKFSNQPAFLKALSDLDKEMARLTKIRQQIADVLAEDNDTDQMELSEADYYEMLTPLYRAVHQGNADSDSLNVYRHYEFLSSALQSLHTSRIKAFERLAEQQAIQDAREQKEAARVAAEKAEADRIRGLLDRHPATASAA